MAESTLSSEISQATPVLPSTADQNPYVPVSWLAVCAGGLAGVFAFLLIGLGLDSFFRTHQPLLQEWLFFPALAAIVVSFAAAKVVRNSEGTRTGTLFGVNLPATAWWTALVLGLGYGTYWFAIDFSIRKDAGNEVRAWADYVLKSDPESLNRAFYRTQDPNQRRQMKPDNGAQLEARWRNEYVGFRQCDFVRLAGRNPDTDFKLGGIRNWSYKANGIECVFTATLTNPEGIFPLQIPMKAIENTTQGAESSRQWQIIYGPAGFIQKEAVRLTPYGWLVGYLLKSGSESGRNFFTETTNRDLRPYAYLRYAEVRPEDRPFFHSMTNGAALGRDAVLGPWAAGAYRPSPEVYDFIADRLLRLPGGSTPSDEQKKTFQYAWSNIGLNKPGERIRDNSDLNEQISFLDSRVEVRVPIEIRLSAVKGDVASARGNIVLVCNDPAVLAELKQLHDSAVPSQAASVPPEGLFSRVIPWKVNAIESDLKNVPQPQQKMPNPPGFPGG